MEKYNDQKNMITGKNMIILKGKYDNMENYNNK